MGTPLQAVLVSSPTRKGGQNLTPISLFKSNGSVHVVPERAAAQTDLGALTSAAAAGATPTKAEFDKISAAILRDTGVQEDVGMEHVDCSTGACPISFGANVTQEEAAPAK